MNNAVKVPQKGTFLRTNTGAIACTPVSKISDSAIWKAAVTPMVQALLGPFVEKGTSRVGETTEGLFPGDEVSNINQWTRPARPGEKSVSLVRFPYLANYYRTAAGAFVVKRDAVKIKAFGWYGDVLSGKPGELVFSFGLRDRRYDGTPRANDTVLLDFPYDEEVNLPLIIHGRKIENATSLETSLYSYLPGTGIAKACGDETLEKFVASPYAFLDRPEEFLRLFQVAWNGGRFPGQVAVPIPDVGKRFHAAVEVLANKAGYDFIETAPSHLHVLEWNRAKGYFCSDKGQEASIAEFHKRVKTLKASGVSLSRLQESWLYVVQSLRPVELIPQGLFLDGPVWPQNNLDQNNLWLYKPLSAKAHKLLAQPQE
jgi:hypothetical protein